MTYFTLVESYQNWLHDFRRHIFKVKFWNVFLVSSILFKNLKIQIFAPAYWSRNFSFVFWENWKKQKALSKLTDLFSSSTFLSWWVFRLARSIPIRFAQEIPSRLRKYICLLTWILLNCPCSAQNLFCLAWICLKNPWTYH